MPIVTQLRNLVRNLIRQRRVERDLDDEIRGYLDMLTDDKISRGLPGAEARREALIELGGIEQVKEEIRDVRPGAYLQSVLSDVRHGVRILAAFPGFAAVALLSLALGLGSAVAMFSVVASALFRPLPYADCGRLVRVTDFYPKGAVVEMQRASRTMELAAFTTDSEFNLGAYGNTGHVSGSQVSIGLFSLLGAHARFGRVFELGEDHSSAVGPVVLSDGLWRRVFRADPAILGKPIAIDGVVHKVVGVMPPDFAFPSAAVQLWMPLIFEPSNWVDYWGAGFIPLIGKLRAGATVAEARGELHELITRIIGLFPYQMARTWNADADVVPLRAAMVEDMRGECAVLTAAVAIVLLIACVNLTTLLLARVATRRKELAMRLALGAAPGRIMRQLVSESLILAAAGAGIARTKY